MRLYRNLPSPVPGGYGAPLDDATGAWRADRRKVKVGRLAVSSVAPTGPPGECEREMFDDPILLVRREAYAISLSRRLEP